MIGDDTIVLFNEFYEFESFIRCLNYTFLVLISKVKGAINVKGFRPISLEGKCV